MFWYIRRFGRYVRGVFLAFWRSLFYHQWSPKSEGLVRDVAHFQMAHWRLLTMGCRMRREKRELVRWVREQREAGLYDD